MEAFSPMGETVMDTSVLASPQSSHLMMGVGEESMETMAMSPKAPETQEVSNERLQQIPAPVLSTDGTLHGLNTSFAGSLSNLMLPGIPNPATGTTSFFLNTTSPTTVAAPPGPFLLNQSNLTTATAGAPQLLMNGSAGVQPNTTFFFNTNPGSSNMQTFLLNPNMAAQGTPLMVQNPQTNTAFFVNPGMLNTSQSTLLLTHPGLAGSNGALMLTANQGAAAMQQLQPQVQPVVTQALAENLTNAASASEVQQQLQQQTQQQIQQQQLQQQIQQQTQQQIQQQTNDASSTLQFRTLQLPLGTLPGTLLQTDGTQNLILQPRVEPADSDTSSVSELSQGIVEENSITENLRENKDSKSLFFVFVYICIA
ncbi:transcription initiation factor TFIID subunit 12b [Strongylocentrotus purpuratus]|uniref:Uncharacterized protein n=1 Tax=Strongylocentrotus purpuratus TaxID=7668 RepID=A0A7M7HHL9_STRPU|nr:transcription initiation factor TFIID subunit 12b [Strongylocentrotus purpuratus]XP_011667944.1 transcription initiation factor TFIID subunit 12b [Strongylocentrotus purpuratus]|eukprot:XP_003730304.1 PREDICTED: transcription initiation factor TFIID subunit 12b [Strongylocentrotus purpuratus]